MKTPGPSAVSNREITQADIDAALREWNGDPDSKRRVQQYMTEHGREKDTADWLRSEYGDNLPAFPVTVDEVALRKRPHRRKLPLFGKFLSSISRSSPI